jgi:hypothetical protein
VELDVFDVEFRGVSKRFDDVRRGMVILPQA